jgi:protein O-mannosyl-transferase
MEMTAHEVVLDCGQDMNRPGLNRERRWLDCLLIAFATLAVWGHTIQFQFAWDDRQFIVENESIRSWEQLPAMLSRRGGQSSLPEHFCLYRPVRTVAYAVLNQIGGGPLPNPKVFHIANVLGHAIAAMLLCGVSGALLMRFGGVSSNSARIAGLLLGLAFAVHPVTSEVVCWAKSFDDILAAIFCLGALAQLLAWKDEHNGRLWVALGLFVLALYSKESAISFALIALAYFWILLRLPFVRSVKLSSGFFVAAAVFVIHRHIVLGQTSQTAPLSGSYWQSLIDTIPCALAYVRLGLGIPPFTIVYNAHLERGRAIFSVEVIAGALVLLAVAAITVLALRSARWRLFGFGLLWALAFFIPVSNIIPMMQFMAERFLYLPLLGLLLAAGILVLQLRQARLAAIGACTAIGLWAAVAWDRSWIWADDLTLFVQTAMNNPRNHVIEDNAAEAILNLESVKRVTQGANAAPPSATEVQNALRVLGKARMAFPLNAPLANSMGVSWISAGELGKAIDCFRDAASASPRKVIYCRNLGMALIRGGRLSEAERVLEKLLPLHENDVPLNRMLCSVLLTQKQVKDAIPLVNRLKELDPNSPEYDQWLAKAHEEAGEISRETEPH